uniref:Protein FAM217A n=1 Tax=Salvator merianae TaxID=96440 RepID=A0A8D0BPI8_SALMN
MNFVNTNPVIHSFMKRCTPLSYPGMQKRLENYCKNGDGDSFQKASETTAIDTYPATDSSSDDMVSVIKWNLKRSCRAEDKLSPEEKNMSESEKSKAMLSYLKTMNLNLKPESIEDEEEIPSSPESDTFSYPDFLPSPYNTLDLQKMSLSKFDDWKLSFNPPLEESLDRLISRLVQMERLQHLTILRERIKESVSPTVAVNSRSGCSRDVHQVMQKPSNPPCPQAAFDEDPPSLGCFVQESDITKCTCQHCHNSKWNLETPSSGRSFTKHCRASCSNLKYAKSPEISGNIVTRRSLSCSRSSQKIRSSLKTASPKLLSPSAAESYCLTDNESSKYKQPRTKRKSCRKNGALMAKTSHSQKLVSLSFISKQKCSHFGHQ